MIVNNGYSGNGSVAYLSDIGNVREINEDSIGYYEDDDIKLLIVADGMGGHNAGDVASKMAVKSCTDYIKSLNIINDVEKAIKDAIIYANFNIYQKSKLSDGLNGMGTTITSCLICGDNAVVANVGDSSGYIITKDGIEKITKDHSLVQELLDDGSITEQEALRHPNKNIITRALGTKRDVNIDTFTIEMNSVNKIILCTDGLSNDVSKEEMYDIILNNNNKSSCELLVDLCKSKGGRDNISVIIFGGEQK